MDFHRDETLDYGTLNVLEIIKEFRQQEWLHIYDMEIRNSENYTSVFDFHRYNHFTNRKIFLINLLNTVCMMSTMKQEIFPLIL